MEPAIFSTNLKKKHPGKMELCKSNIKEFFTFSQKKAFLIFQETELSYISGKIYSHSWHNGTFLIFQKRNIQNTGIAELCYISGGTF